MNARSRLLAGALILALGAGTLWLAATQSEDDVRFVEAILAAPDAHRSGTYTLMGVPEPAQVPVAGPSGVALDPNPAYDNVTRSTVRWHVGGAERFSTHTLRVEAQPDGRLRWTFRNETRAQPADPHPLLPPVEASWVHGRAGEAFPILAFSSDAQAHAGTPRLWAVYAEAPQHPMQPKPSQFTGRLLSALPDGTPLPAGALVYQVEEFTAGCSSKFLPPESREKYEALQG